MLIEIIIALLTGIFAGTITGLLPGIHINLIGAILVSASISVLSGITPIYFAVFIVAMSITHSFLDFIPSIFLGCPEDGTELSILPGHHLLKKGRGYEAVMLTAYGGLSAILILLISSAPLTILIPKIYPLISKFIPYILILILIFMIFSEKNKFSALLVIFLTGILGYIVLNLELKESLLPLLAGLFGASSLMISVSSKTKIPKQKISEKIKPNFIKPLAGLLISSPICGFLPGLGSGQAAVIGNTIAKTDDKGFLVLLGATNTLIMSLSFISLYTIHKKRTGSAAAIESLIGNFEINILMLILSICFISGLISFFLTKFLAKKFTAIVNSINYSNLSIFTLVFVSLIVLIFSGFLGLLIFIISTFTGIYCIQTSVKRTNMMACLLVPTIMLYLL
ncbi:MAG: tripartite tricarboxylate transporter permease [Nanoarchaeota archaeon]